MLKKFNKHIKNEKGLTLIELLAVIVILAIIAAIAIPSISNIIGKQKDKAVLANASLIISGAKLALVDGACGSDTTCNGTELQPFVEGVTLASTDSVVKSGTTAAPIYTLTWVNNHDFTQITGAKTSDVTETQIQEWMGKK